MIFTQDQLDKAVAAAVADAVTAAEKRQAERFLAAMDATEKRKNIPAHAGTDRRHITVSFDDLRALVSALAGVDHPAESEARTGTFKR